MLKASALYIVIIIALVIAVLCSSLIVAAYFYRNEYQNKFRYDRLQNNVNSGVNILLGGADTGYAGGSTFSLYNNDEDSVSLKKLFWGMYDVGVSVAFSQRDTLYKTFSIGYNLDSAKWAALYLVDKQSPVSMSGQTTIRGNAYLPNGQINTSYIDNKFYSGDKRLVIGHKYSSEKDLPPFSSKRFSSFQAIMNDRGKVNTSLLAKDSIQTSFTTGTLTANFGKQPDTLKNIRLSGNIIIFSDTLLVVDSSAVLEHVMVFAKTIILAHGFHGNCQLFALDSISVGQRCTLDYPSCLGILRLDSNKTAPQAKIHLAGNCRIGGLIFTYEKSKNERSPIIAFDNQVNMTGQVYSQGLLETMDKDTVNGSIFTSAYCYVDSGSLYQNYLINITIDADSLSPYYLSTDVLPSSGKKKRLLEWLEVK